MERVDKSLALSQYLAFRYVFDDVKFVSGGGQKTGLQTHPQ